ncbi:MAG: response regulator [Caulobacteraceae bacterium]|nr:response regulator [Caulobacteraceae bacterium]
MNAHVRIDAERPRRILCVEDDLETANLLAEALGERGYDVRIAHDGRAGFAAILDFEPDVVLCDIGLPVASGFDLLERVTAAAPRFGEMPFIFLTALADRESELRGRRLGADDYVTKPVDFDMLATIIEARLRRLARDSVWPSEVRLSAREVDVLTWSARGKTSEEIARILDLTKRTVDFHFDTARGKLQVATRIQAVVKAVSGRLIAV